MRVRVRVRVRVKTSLGGEHLGFGKIALLGQHVVEFVDVVVVQLGDVPIRVRVGVGVGVSVRVRVGVRTTLEMCSSSSPLRFAIRLGLPNQGDG